MSLSRKVKVAKTLVDVRSIQHLSAQGELERRTAAVKALQLKQQRQAADHLKTQAAWEASVVEPSLRIAVVGAWAQAVLTGQEDLRALGEEIASAEEEKLAGLTVWQLAQARLDAAKAFEHSAARRLRRQQEESATEAAADRAAQNWSSR